MGARERVKVTRNYQVTIPSSIRRMLGLREGDYVEIWFDEEEGVVKLAPARRRRLTIRLGRRVTVEEIEGAVEDYLGEATS